MRHAAEQVCPAFWMPALTRKGSAASRSASANTSCGLLPPSSSVTGTAFFAAAAWISAPTATEPVNEMWRTPGCAPQRCARFLAQARHDVERPGRQAGASAMRAKASAREAGLLGRLEHAGVAHRQRRADAAADDLHRVVPRHDVRRHAVRLAQRERGVAVGEGNGLAVHLVGGAAVELEVARQRHRVGAALLQGLADIQRLEPRQFVGLLQHSAPICISTRPVRQRSAGPSHRPALPAPPPPRHRHRRRRRVRSRPATRRRMGRAAAASRRGRPPTAADEDMVAGTEQGQGLHGRQAR